MSFVTKLTSKSSLELKDRLLIRAHKIEGKKLTFTQGSSPRAHIANEHSSMTENIGQRTKNKKLDFLCVLFEKMYLNSVN